MSNFSVTLHAPDAPATQALAARLARSCGRGDCILLSGDLGSGKTTFARGFIGAVQQGSEDVVSPTFMLAQSYPSRQGWPVWHFDLYRIHDARELDQLGIDDAVAEGVVLVEWPKIAEGRWPQSALAVDLAIEGEARRIMLSGEAGEWQSRLAGLA